MSKPLITSHCFGCFWVHITWNNRGVGEDQNGRKWVNFSDPKPADFVWLPEMMQTLTDVIAMKLKIAR